MSTAFIYRPLRTEAYEIRLWDIAPVPRFSPQDETDNPGRAWQCSLRHVTLATEPKPLYETVSYCWGDTELSDAIEIEACTLRVPRSALEVLIRLALPDQTRTLWIDAVCIDQLNENERSQQVTQMRYIYRYGARNIIYLGEEHYLTERALENLVALHLEITSELLLEGQGIWSSAVSRWRSTRPLKTNVDIEALISLYSCPWFTRVWVSQEAVLIAENIAMRGSVEFGVNTLIEVAAAVSYPFIESLSSEVARVQGFYNASTLWMCQYSFNDGDGNGIALDGLLRATRRLSCSDARDRVFGVLGITAITSSPETAEAAEQLLKPDYNKALPDVLRDATRFCIIQDGSLGVLGHVQSGDHLGQCGSKRASWALTEESFSHRFYQTWASPLRTARPEQIHSIISANMPDRCDDLDRLHGYGFNIGIIAECSTVLAWSGSNHSARLGATWSTLDDFFRTSIDICDRAGNTTSDLARAMTANRGVLDVPWQVDQQFEWFSILQQVIAEEAAGTATIYQSSDSDDEMRVKPMSQFLDEVQTSCRNGRLFSTNAGVLGIGPAAMQPGDIVAFLYSAENPCILRPIEDGTYSFLADCYVNTLRSEEDVERCRIDNAASAKWYTLL